MSTITNNRARFEYHIIESEVAGVLLYGSEIKSLREGKAGLSEAFIWIDEENHAVWIKNMYIKNETNNAYSHEELRERKLLMTKKQILKWCAETATKGVTIIPLKGFFDKNNRFKIEIALGKGKNLYDKKQKIKEKDIDRDVQRELNKL